MNSATQVAPATWHPKKRTSDPILGALLALCLTLFAGAMWWTNSGQGLTLLQLPLLLISFMLAVGVGFLYFLNPARALTYVLLGLMFFSFEVTARGQEAGGGGDAQTLVKGVLAFMFAVFGMFTSLRHVFKSKAGFFLTYYAVWALGTASYSPTMILGIASGIALLGVTLVSNRIGMGDAEDVQDFWKALYWAAALICILSFLTLAILPAQARDMTDISVYRFRGVTGAANTLGPIMGLGAIMAMLMYRLTTKRSMRFFHGLMLVSMVVALFLTNSRSSIVGFVVAMFSAAVVMGSVGLMGVLLIGLLTSMLGVALFYPGLSDAIMGGLASLFSRSGQISELTTLTGRHVIWEACWKLFTDQPIFGYGLGSIRVVLPLAYSDAWGNTVGTAHNLVLESLVSVGLAGTLPLLILIGICVHTLITYFSKRRRLIKAKVPVDPDLNRLLSMCALRCLLMLLVQGISEKSFAGQPGSSTLALGAIVCTTAFISRVKNQRLPRA